MTINNICKEHSGCMARLDNIEKDDVAQWKEINTMKKWLLATLTTSVFSLLGIIVLLISKLIGQ